MASHRRWMFAVRAACAAVFLWIALSCGVSLAAEDACFTQIRRSLPSPHAVFSVEKDATTKKPVYTLLGQTGCETGACAHVFLSHDKGALPTAAIAGEKAGVAVAHKDGACSGAEAHAVTYSRVPAPAAGSCEEKVAQLSTSADLLAFVSDGGASARLVRGAACGAAGCRVRYATTDATAALVSMSVHTLDACDGKARYIDVAPAGTPAAAKPSGELAQKPSVVRQKQVLEGYRNRKTSESLLTEAAVTLPGAPAVAAPLSPAASAAGEVLQILGQIVVDRASEAAYLRARDEIVKLLGCEKADAGGADEKKDEEDSDKLGDKVKFPRTCRVVRAVRLQDLAMSRWPLVQALVQDLVMALLPSANNGAHEKLARSLTLVAKDVLSDLPRIGVGGSSTAPATLLWGHAQEGLSHAGEAIAQCQDDPCRVVALAAVALASCHLDALKERPEGRAAALRTCLVEDTVDTLAGSPPEYHKGILEAAKRIATGWLGAETAVTPEGTPDHRTRARYAVNATFDVGCLWLYSNDMPRSKCPAQIEPEQTSELGDKRHVASLIRYLTISAIDGDTNAVMAGLSMGVEVVLRAVNSGALSKDEKKALSRALRLCGAVLQYAETFTKPGAKEDAQALHDRRTKILESLTREMTNREGREGDHIFSLGGSLRAVAGARIDPNGEPATFFGPLSLPLGIGFQSAQGLHLEFGIFDLGQYLSYQQSSTGIQVRKPEPADALSPSFTLGWSWGKSFPTFVGLTVGYAPQFDFTTTTSRSVGSINLGATVGVYVPLFDLN
jgi:hypothetical protein